jgi:predicted urease superfamily metal-dependent hydrolase
MERQEIDYTELNEHIVRQAYKAAGMTPAEVTKLIEDKFERAKQLSEALQRCSAV